MTDVLQIAVRGACIVSCPYPDCLMGIGHECLRESKVPEIAANVLSALTAAGFRIVPAEPTEAMMMSGSVSPMGQGLRAEPDECGMIYRAMLAATEVKHD